MKKEKFAELTERVIALSKNELRDNMNLLDRCIEELEKKKESFAKPKKRLFDFGTPAVNWIEGAGVGNCGCALTKEPLI